MAKVDAVVIGGGRITDPKFREAAGVHCKSLISIHGKTMAQWVVEALTASESIGSTVVVGPRELIDTEVISLADHLLPEGGHEVDNLMAGVDALPDAEMLLMVSSDMPLLSPEALDDLVRNSPDADIVYPTVEKTRIIEQFPDRKWVFVRAKEGEFTGSSAVLFRPEAFRNHRETLRKVFDARRSVADLVKMWGMGFALKFAMGQLSLRDVEERISQVLKVASRAYISRYPELAFDVDKASDIEIARARCRLNRSAVPPTWMHPYESSSTSSYPDPAHDWSYRHD